MLNRDAILAVQDIKTADVDVPEWGGTVRLRMLSGAERNALNEKASAGGSFDLTVFQSTLVAMTLVGEDGGRLFRDDEGAELSSKSSVAFNRVFEAAASLNGLGAKAAETAEKNS